MDDLANRPDPDEDDFDAEIEALSRNREFMDFLEERSKEKVKGRYSLEEVKKRLGLD